LYTNWEESDGILWKLNQLVYAGAATTLQYSKTGKKAESYKSQLKIAIKQTRKTTGANRKLSKLVGKIENDKTQQEYKTT